MSEIRVEPVAYDIDGQPYEGQLVYDASHAGPRPGLLMAPNWMGVSAAALDIARQVAGRGHVVLVADLYGRDVRPQNGDEAGAAMMPLKNDRALLRKRMQAALAALRGQALAAVDTTRQAAFGFCFGGCCALELARDGAELKAFVSFHGTLDTPDPAHARNIKGRGTGPRRCLRSAGAARAVAGLRQGDDRCRRRLAAHQLRRRGAFLHRSERQAAGQDAL